MRELKIALKIGSQLASSFRALPQIAVMTTSAFVLSHSAWTAADLSLTAEVDRPQVSVNDTVALKLTVRSQNNSNFSEPQFKASDFEVLSESSSISVSSRYDSSTGTFSTQKVHQFTKILRPTHVGTFKVSQIELNVGGKVVKAPDVSIQVLKEAPQRQQQRSAPRQAQGTHAMIRAEVDKTSYFKGEQVIVSYYLYHQMRVFNVQVDKFPILTGFLRQDLEVPVMGQRLESESVILNGERFQRSLLARYAAYPLEEGKLKIDSASLKFNYYVNTNNSNIDEDDPFFSFGFFQQMVPKAWIGKSEPLEIQVSPLPEQGKPSSFTGGVGEFSVISAVNKYEVKANEAVNLTVKIEGKGNVSSIQEPKIQWPEGLDFYDSSGKTQTSKSGTGEKIFEFVLIPREPGQLSLPSIEFGFFDPDKKTYYTKKTDPIVIQVGEPVAGTSIVRKQPKQEIVKNPNSTATNRPQVLRGLKPPLPEDVRKNSGRPIWQILYWICIAALAFLGILIGMDLFRKAKARNSKRQYLRSGAQGKIWVVLQDKAQSASNGLAWKDVTQTYETLGEEVLNGLESTYSLGVRSISRAELRDVLIHEKGMSEPVWNRIACILEYVDTVRFASAAGGISENVARSELAKWVSEGQSVMRSLENSK